MLAIQFISNLRLDPECPWALCARTTLYNAMKMSRNSPFLLSVIGLWMVLNMSVVYASNIPTELIGVWRGTLGSHEIVVCWDQYGGSYYKLQKPLRIALNADTQNRGSWLENEEVRSETTISWQLKERTGTHLIGTQLRKSKSLKQTIRLARVQVVKTDKENEPSCTFNSALHDAFNAPRIAAEQIQVGEPISFMNKPYRVITALRGHVASVELIGEDELIAKANKILRKEFMYYIGRNLSCEVFERPKQGEFKSKLRLRFWNGEWLSWSGHVEGYCGGAHPFFESSTRNINLSSGKEVNLWDWFKLKLVKNKEDKSGQVCEFLKDRCLSLDLAKRVLKTRSTYEGKECKGMNFHEMVDGGYSLGLNEKGIAFVPVLSGPARAMVTCYGNYTIPFAELLPYLNQSGLAAVNRILIPASEDVR